MWKMRLGKNHSCLFFPCVGLHVNDIISYKIKWIPLTFCPKQIHWRSYKLIFLKAKQQKLPWFQWQWWGFPSHQSRLHNFRLVPDVQQSAGRSTQAGWTACDGLQEEQWRKQELNHALMETDKQLVQVKEIGSTKRTTVRHILKLDHVNG